MSLKTSAAAINDHEPPLPIILFGIVAHGFVGQPLSKQLYISLIIQQIVTLSKYGHDALDICHP